VTGSIRSWFFYWTLLLLGGGWVMLLMYNQYHISSEIDQLYDHEMVQLAAMLDVIGVHELTEGEEELAKFEQELHARKDGPEILYQVWDRRGLLLLRGPNTPLQPMAPPDQRGFSLQLFAGEQWRVLTRAGGRHGHLVQVAQNTMLREARARAFVWRQQRPLLFAAPLLLLFWFMIERGLTPLRRVARELALRDPLRPKPLNLMEQPLEIQPLLQEINALMARNAEVVAQHQAFAANAAHELRTPVAGVVAQLHLAREADSQEQRDMALDQALRAMQRFRRILEQLLVLARRSPNDPNQGFLRFDLRELAVDILAELYPGAIAHAVDLELHGPERLRAYGNPELLGILLSNLVENAIRVSPAGGLISILLEQGEGQVRLRVEDQGPGIPEDAQSEVFERLRRLPDSSAEGSGIGLSIVRAIAVMHGATLGLQNREPGPGLVVEVVLPRDRELVL